MKLKIQRYFKINSGCLKDLLCFGQYVYENPFLMNNEAWFINFDKKFVQDL